MSRAGPQFISSASNPLVKDLRRLAQDNTAYRKQGRVWLEGDHLGRAAVTRGQMPAMAVFARSAWDEAEHTWARDLPQLTVVDDVVFRSLSGLESPSRIAFLLDLPTPQTVDAVAPTVVLDRVQDAGNVGSILRSAAAFGFTQVLALKGTAALWSPKVVRAGMGAHFGLRLVESLDEAGVANLSVPMLATSSHSGDFLHDAVLPWPCAWLMGHEGSGISPQLADCASRHIRIAQPGGEESLNVAAAAAICLHASGVSARRL